MRVDLSKVTECPAAPPYQPLLLAGRVTRAAGLHRRRNPDLAAHAGGYDKLDILRRRRLRLQSVRHRRDYQRQDHQRAAEVGSERFVRAYLKAFKFTIDKPQEAADVLMAVDAKLDRNVLLDATGCRHQIHLHECQYREVRPRLHGSGALAVDAKRAGHPESHQ